MKIPFYILGAGGHAKVVVSICIEKRKKIEGVLDEDKNKWGKELLGIPIIGGFADLKNNRSNAIIGIGNNKIRSKIAKKYTNNVDWITAIHPLSYVHPSVTIGYGSVIMAGVVIQPDTVIGNHVVINTSASIDHDCVINDYAHVAPGVHLAGGVEIGQGTLLGISSSAIPCVKIGEWSVIGAGSVVVNDIPSKKMAVGIPAKIKKAL